MKSKKPARVYFQTHIFLPQDHGSWVFLLSPLLIGVFAGGELNSATPFLLLGAMAAFLIRQPVTILIKVISGRRSKNDLLPAIFWSILYAIFGLVALVALTFQGYGFVLILAVPALPVFAWHLGLVSRRAERHQVGVEIVGCGVLALAAPAAYWVGVGQVDPIGWWLWGLTWFQSAASIVYAYLRLEQRKLVEIPPVHERLRMGFRALLYTTFNVFTVLILGIFLVLPPLLWIPYAIQWIETIYGTLRPAVKAKPTAIGIRQLIVSSIFTVTFIITWMLS